jgi:hypothetical protein
MCGKKLKEITPHLNLLTKNISKVHLDSSVRPAAKVCEYLIKAYYSKQDLPIKAHFTESHKEKIIEACFNLMLNDENITKGLCHE